MKEIITIVIRLTVSCLVAGLVMGSFFILTSKAKKHNAHVNEEKVIYSLLGYQNSAKVPESMKLYDLYRYVVSGPDGKFIGYLIPTGNGKEAGHLFVSLDLSGNLADQKQVSIKSEEAMDEENRDKAIVAALGSGKDILLADKTIIVYCASGGRSALAGKTLKDLGYDKVLNLGAFKDWAEAGGEIERPIEPGMTG